MQATTFTGRRMRPGTLPFCPLPPRPARPRRARRQPLPEYVPVRRVPLVELRPEPVVLDGTQAEPRNILDTISSAVILALAGVVCVLAIAWAGGLL